MRRRWVVVGVVMLALLGAACGAGSDNGAADVEAASQPTPEATVSPIAPTSTPGVAPTPTEAAVEPAPTSIPTSTPAPSLNSLIPGFETLGATIVTETEPASIDPMCPGWDQFEGLKDARIATRTFRDDPTLGPFMTVGLIEVADGGADALLDAYLAGATGPCASFTTTGASGNTLNLAWSEITGPEHGDRTITLAARGDSDGFPVNSDIVLVRVGDRVGYVGYLVVGGLPSQGIRDIVADSMARSVAGQNPGTVDTTGAIDRIGDALPGLNELANPGLLDEANDATLPNAQCPGNPSTLGGLTLLQAGVRRFLGSPDFGPHVTVAILEFAPDDADAFIDRWVDGANGPCAEYTSGALEFGWSVGSGPEYLDRTVTLFGRGLVLNTADPASSDYVLVRSGNFVGYIHYFLTDTVAPDTALRDAMVQELVMAVEELTR